MLAEGWTLLYGESNDGAFLYGWMIIETFLEEIWEQYVDAAKRSADDKNALKDHRSWTSYHHIETLALLKKMKDETRDYLNDLRRTRNNIVHKRNQVTHEQASECLSAAMKIVLNRMLNPDEPFRDVVEGAMKG